MPAKLGVEAEKWVYAKAGNEKRNGQSGRVKHRQKQAAFPATAGRRQTNDAAQDRSDTWRPACRERNAKHQRSPDAPRLVTRKLTRISVEVLDLQQTDQMQPEDNNDQATNHSHPNVVDDSRAHQARGRAEGEKKH